MMNNYSRVSNEINKYFNVYNIILTCVDIEL